MPASPISPDLYALSVRGVGIPERTPPSLLTSPQLLRATSRALTLTDQTPSYLAKRPYCRWLLCSSSLGFRIIAAPNRHSHKAPIVSIIPTKIEADCFLVRIPGYKHSSEKTEQSRTECTHSCKHTSEDTSGLRYRYESMMKRQPALHGKSAGFMYGAS